MCEADEGGSYCVECESSEVREAEETCHCSGERGDGYVFRGMELVFLLGVLYKCLGKETDWSERSREILSLKRRAQVKNRAGRRSQWRSSNGCQRFEWNGKRSEMY
jgi:hypothetical protein